MLTVPRVLARKTADGGPIELLAALSAQPQESVAQQAGERHRHLESLSRRQRKANVLISERRGEGRWLKPSLSDQAAIGLVSRRGEDRRGEELDIGAPVDASLADERDGLAQPLYGGRQQ